MNHTRHQHRVVDESDHPCTGVARCGSGRGREEPVGHGFVRLTVKPLRKEITLVDGAVFVTDTDADLVRIEGMETS